MKRRLRVSGDMRHDALEQLRLVRGRAHVGVEVLELDLLAPEVVAEAVKLAALVLLPSFIFKGVALDPFPDLGRVLVQDAAHGDS